MDEHTAGFNGRHADKKRITYNAEVDGFHMDVVCNHRIIFAYYIKNHPDPKEYLNMGLLPLHSRLFSLFDNFNNEYHKVNFGNLYSSTIISFAAYVKHKKKLSTQGVCQGGHVIPPHVTQAKESDKNKSEELRLVIFTYLF